MKQYFILTILFVLNINLQSQIIRGIVTDENNLPLMGANILISGSYDGTISDSLGRFQFYTNKTDSQLLIASYVGCKNFNLHLFLNKLDTLTIPIILIQFNTNLSEVTISAGTFEAGDKKRGVQLKAMDILTTANSNGDIYGALSTMPGAQMVGEEGVLFVRGGEKNESKTFVDGMLVSNPYTSKLPDMPMRGRFSPSLFTGVQFSSGGYSAEYGQALSSALVLQTYNYPSKTYTSISLMPFGAGVNQTIKGDSSSLAVSVNYFNMKPYYSLVKQSANWNHEPEGIQSNVVYRKKLKKSGLIKSFGSFSNSTSALHLPQYLTTSGNQDLSLKNNNLYLNTVYTGQILSEWNIKAGVAFNYDDEFIAFNHFKVSAKNRFGEIRLSVQKQLTEHISIKAGSEVSQQNYRQNYERTDSAYSGLAKFNSPIAASFLETEWKISPKLFSRLGARFEYSNFTSEFSIVPRIAIAYKTGDFSQISAAYGIFTQLPRDEYIKFASQLSSEKAIHYILNYQYAKANRLFRIETYYKKYDNLVCYATLNDIDPSHYNNNGNGYARGFDIFFRDQKTFKYGDYWLTYTYLDTRKLYQDIPVLATPPQFAKHSATAVGKYFVAKLKSQIGVTYQFYSGRPYQIPDNNMFKQGMTQNYHNLSGNLSYLTRIFKYFTVVHLSVNNILGFNQIYGYHYVKNAGETTHTSYPIKPTSKRFFLLAVFITFDKEYIQY